MEWGAYFCCGVVPVKGKFLLLSFSLRPFLNHSCPLSLSPLLSFSIVVQTCQPHPQHPLPRDIKCTPCSKEDIVSTISECRDAEGKQNETYRWVQPKTCNDNANGSIGLPPDVAAGYCIQTFMWIPSKGITLPTAILLATVGVGVIVSAILTYCSYRKSRKIYEQYAQLVEMENSKGKDLDSPQPEALVTGLRSDAIRIHDMDE